MGKLLALLLFLFPFLAFAEAEKRGVILRWLPLQEAAKYEIELSDTERFQAVKEKKALKETKLLLELLPGTYYYRVRGVHHLGTPGPWSDPRPLAVNPFPPKLLLPKNQTEIFQAPSKRSLKFIWNPGLTGSAYMLEVYRGSERVFNRELAKPQYEWKSEPGDYRWRVGYQDSALPQWSDWSSFRVTEQKFLSKTTSLKCSYTQGEKLEVVFERAPQESDGIPDFDWSSEGCEVTAIAPKVYLTFQGRHLSRQTTGLFFDQRAIQKTVDGRFRVRIELKGPNTNMEFSAPLVDGQTAKESIRVHLDDWDDIVDSWRVKPQLAKRFGLFLGLSYTPLTYDQTNVAHFTQSSLTGKLGLSYRLSENLELGSSFYTTVLALSSNQAGVTARSLGINLRAGYRLPFISEPWRFTLMAGGYYTSVTGTASVFGYSFYGPQFYPTLRRSFGRTAVSVYFKLSPLSDSSGTGLSFSNREIAGGGALSFFLNSGHSIFISFDASSLSATLATASKTVELSTYSIGLGYEF